MNSFFTEKNIYDFGISNDQKIMVTTHKEFFKIWKGINDAKEDKIKYTEIFSTNNLIENFFQVEFYKNGFYLSQVTKKDENFVSVSKYSFDQGYTDKALKAE